MKTNEELIKYIENYCKKNDYPCETGEDLFETLRESGDFMYREVHDYHRWWNTIFVVVDLKGQLIGYIDAHTTGEDSAEDLGWEFDPSSICSVQEKTRTETYYVRAG